MVYMDENGDAEGNYTVIALGNQPTRGYGLYPIAHFVGKEEGTNLPVSERTILFTVTLFPKRKNTIWNIVIVHFSLIDNAVAVFDTVKRDTIIM